MIGTDQNPFFAEEYINADDVVNEIEPHIIPRIKKALTSLALMYPQRVVDILDCVQPVPPPTKKGSGYVNG